MGSTTEPVTSFVVDPPSGARLPHYFAVMLLVCLSCAGLVYAFGRTVTSEAPTEFESAVLVDLEPAEASSRPEGEDAPTQQAAPASIGAKAPPLPQKPPEKTTPAKPTQSASHETAPPLPAPAAVLNDQTKPPPQTLAPASQATVAHVTGEAQAPKQTAGESDDAVTHRASAHQITIWQKALMARLQTARRGLSHQGHDTGLVKVAFSIDRDGQLVSEHVAQGSGSPSLDSAALGLVRRAAPYPSPPPDAGGDQLSFVVPISFKR